VFLGVRAGDNLIYVAEAGSDTLSGFAAKTNIRRGVLDTAGGKALLAAMSESDRVGHLRSRGKAEAPSSSNSFPNTTTSGARGSSATPCTPARSAIATTVGNRAGDPFAEVTIVGPTPQIAPGPRNSATYCSSTSTAGSPDPTVR
jgi:DNA-binding IclR family transcriptional regulator